MKNEKPPQTETPQEQTAEEQEFQQNFKKVEEAMEVIRKHCTNVMLVGMMKGHQMEEGERRGALLMAEGDMDELGSQIGRISKKHRQVRYFASALEHLTEAVVETSGGHRSAGGGRDGGFGGLLAGMILDGLLSKAKAEREKRNTQQQDGAGEQAASDPGPITSEPPKE